MMPIPLLKIRNLCISFSTPDGKKQILKDVNLTVNKGKTLALVGESGSGKSMTALASIRLVPKPGIIHKNTSISFNGKDLMKYSISELRSVRGNDIAMVFQEPMSSLNPVISVGNQIVECIKNHSSVSYSAAKSRSIELLQQVGIPNAKACFQTFPHQLSGGMKQRIMIAMAMSLNAKLLIADEPTTALDVSVQKQIIRLLKKLQRENGTSILFITHDLALVSQIADDVSVMYRGKIVEQGPCKQVLITPKHNYTKKLLSAMPVNLKPLKKSNPYGAKTKKILTVTNLNTWFPVKKGLLKRTVGYVKAVNGINFDVIEGEVLALVGESGCGKTTIGRSILRLIEPTAGQVSYKGLSVLNCDIKKMNQLRKEFQIIFQDPASSINPRLRVRDIIAEGLNSFDICRNDTERTELVKKMMIKVQLEPDAIWRYPHEFSGGQRQRIVIARALILNPKFVVCDESVSALDVSVQAEILGLLKQLQRDMGLTYLFITHDLAVVKYFADRILVMNKGKIVETNDTIKIFKSPQATYTKKLLSAIPTIS